MTHAGHSADAVEHFLGPEAARGGPHALLGLPRTGFTELDVIQARERQLRRVDEHKEAQTPAADEVRLALHAATAQLLNPAVRDRLYHTSLADQRRAALLGLEQDVVLTLGMFGGWTRKSLPRLVALAHARGLQASDVAETVRRLSRRTRTTSPRTSDKLTASDSHRPAVEPHAPPAIGAAWVIASVALASIVISGWIIHAALNSSAPQHADTSAPNPGDRSRQDALVLPPPREVAATPGGAIVPATAKVAKEDLFETFDRALALASTDPDTAEELSVAAIGGLSRFWHELTGPMRTRAQDTVVELMYRIGGSAMNSRRLLEAIGAGSMPMRSHDPVFQPGDVARAAWSVGMLTRLRRENDLSAQSQALIDRWLGSALQGARPTQLNFTDGALAALQRIAEPLAAQQSNLASAWDTWARCVVILTESDVARRSMLLARGAELVLMSPVGPERRSETFEAIDAVIAAMPWRQSLEIREWFVRQFDNRDVSTPALSAATRALVAHADADHVDPTMVLAATANDLDRREIRDRYITAWNLDEPGSDLEVLDKLDRVSTELADGLRADADAEQWLRTAIGYARLNAAAAARWQGDSASATRLLDHAVLSDSLAARSTPEADLHAPSDGNWAERYLLQNANIAQRLELLDELWSGSRRRLGPIDAEVLVSEAIRGSGRGVRKRARETVEAFGSSPAVVNALLEEAHRIPPVPDLADLIVSVTMTPLPDRNSPRWRIAVRRALVDRLLELLAAESTAADIDLLASLFDDAYYERAITNRVIPTSPDAATPPAARSAGLLRTRWDRIGERSVPTPAFDLNPAEIQRHYTARKALARGLVQHFVVEQRALAETMAYVIAAERPDAVASIHDVLDRLERDLQAAVHVFQQVALGERAMLELWQIRLGSELLREEG